MKRSHCTHAVVAFLGSAMTLAIVLWLQRGAGRAIAEGGGAATPSGNGDVNGDSKLSIADAIYLLQHLFQGGEAPLPIGCPPTGLPATGQTRCYDTWSYRDCVDGVFPGQDGSFQAGCPTEGRFVDGDNGTVVDACTGLMWQKDTADVNGNGSSGAEDSVDWQGALKYCADLELADHSDWRLPNVRELESIVDYGRHDPAIDPVFAGMLSEWYWSSSTFDDGEFVSYAWHVFFKDGVAIYGGLDKTNAQFVRAVRGGP